MSRAKPKAETQDGPGARGGGQDPHARTYWEHAGPGRWIPVVVRVRYGPGRGDQSTALPHVQTAPAAPRNVLVEREDGTTDVRPVRLLRVKRPA